MKGIFLVCLLFLFTFDFVIGQVVYEKNVVVNTFAGGDFADGIVSNAKFKNPNGICVDSLGNIFVADYYNNRIRKITPNGLVSTFAGTGLIGSLDGQGVVATFNGPKGITIDKSGNLFVTETGNHKIRKIDTYGVVSTFAGSGNYGSLNGQGIAARFYNPSGIVIDAMGNLFIADVGNNMIRKITPSGLVSNFAGSYNSGATDGIGSNATFRYPEGIAIDSLGILYIADTQNSLIRKVSKDGTVTTIAGNGFNGSKDGMGSLATFNNPKGIVLDKLGNIFVVDANNNLIRKINSNGYVNTFVGKVVSGSSDGQGVNASFNYPNGIAIDFNGNLLVTDASNNLIRKISSSGLVTTVAGMGSSNDGQGILATFITPSGIALDKLGNIYISELNNNKIRKITRNGLVITLAGSGFEGSIDAQGGAASFKNPKGVAVDTNGNLLIADFNNSVIRKITQNGMVSTFAGNGSHGSIDGQANIATFFGPSDVIVDKNNIAYIADFSNNKIRKVTPEGTVTTFAGIISNGSVDGQVNLASFNNPSNLAVDDSGNIYVSDYSNHKIRKITPNGFVSTFAGTGTKGLVDGQGNIARFNNPKGLSIDMNGNIYVADWGNNVIRKITPQGNVSTLAGMNSSGMKNGISNYSKFFQPTDLAIDEFGDIFVTDYGNSLIRKIETYKKGNDSPFFPTKLENYILFDTLLNFKRGRQVSNSCVLSVPDSNVIDAFYTFVATSSDSMTLILTLNNSSLLSSLNLIDTINYNSISSQCLNKPLSGNQREYTFYNLLKGNKYEVRVEIGSTTSSIGNARLSNLNNVFKVELKSVVNSVENRFEKLQDLSIFPNPTQSEFKIANKVNIKGDILLIDMHGNIVLSEVVDTDEKLISTSEISNGVYILKVITEDATYIKKLVISK